MNRINSVLKSSRAAIDLASIMVGIIVIGLIGGVIAATVFAVIPWSQDNAAKNQLESIHTAENALYGLSSDSNVTLQGGATKASFGSSSHLDANNLLSLNKNGEYCVVPTVDGKDYHAYVKSGSGKWFTASSSKKAPQIVAGSISPCITSGANVGTVDPTVDDGTKDLTNTGGDTGTTNPAPAPVYTPVYTYTFEQYGVNDKITVPWTAYNGSYNEVRLDVYYRHAGGRALYVAKDPTKTVVGVTLNQKGLTPGETYRISGWIMTENNNNVELKTSATNTTGQIASTAKTWQQISLNVVADSQGAATPTFYTSTTFIHLDDVTVDKVS